MLRTYISCTRVTQREISFSRWVEQIVIWKLEIHFAPALYSIVFKTWGLFVSMHTNNIFKLWDIFVSVADYIIIFLASFPSASLHYAFSKPEIILSQCVISLLVLPHYCHFIITAFNVILKTWDIFNFAFRSYACSVVFET